MVALHVHGYKRTSNNLNPSICLLIIAILAYLEFIELVALLPLVKIAAPKLGAEAQCVLQVRKRSPRVTEDLRTDETVGTEKGDEHIIPEQCEGPAPRRHGHGAWPQCDAGQPHHRRMWVSQPFDSLLNVALRAEWIERRVRLALRCARRYG